MIIIIIHRNFHYCLRRHVVPVPGRHPRLLVPRASTDGGQLDPGADYFLRHPNQVHNYSLSRGSTSLFSLLYTLSFDYQSVDEFITLKLWSGQTPCVKKISYFSPDIFTLNYNNSSDWSINKCRESVLNSSPSLVTLMLHKNDPSLGD